MGFDGGQHHRIVNLRLHASSHVSRFMMSLACADFLLLLDGTGMLGCLLWCLRSVGLVVIACVGSVCYLHGAPVSVHCLSGNVASVADAYSRSRNLR